VAREIVGLYGFSAFCINTIDLPWTFTSERRRSDENVHGKSLSTVNLGTVNRCVNNLDN
jgi:hypothetical protein